MKKMNNSTVSRTNTLRKQPGDRNILKYVLLDSISSLLAWMPIRDNIPGNLFYCVNDHNMIEKYKG